MDDNKTEWVVAMLLARQHDDEDAQDELLREAIPGEFGSAFSATLWASSVWAGECGADLATEATRVLERRAKDLPDIAQHLASVEDLVRTWANGVTVDTAEFFVEEPTGPTGLILLSGILLVAEHMLNQVSKAQDRPVIEILKEIRDGMQS